VNVQELISKRHDVQLVDVRHPHEWQAGHIEGSVHLPLDELAARLGEVDRARPVVMVCRSGRRGAEAVNVLSAHGLQAENLEGGILAWVEYGHPLVSETQPTPAQRGGSHIGLATPSMRDMELAATVAATAEDLGYSTIWVADEPTRNGVAVAARMLQATTTIRVGIGPVAMDPSRAKTLVGELGSGDLVPGRTAVALEGMDSSDWTPASRRSAFMGLRDVLGTGLAVGVCALGEDMCRLGGELADLVCLDWMSPQRIAWARRHIDHGTARRSGGAGGPQVVGCIHVAFGPGAALRLNEEAGPYRAKPHYAASFEAMGSASAGIAAVRGSDAWGLAEAFTSVLDETVIRPVATLPTSESPTLDEVFEALSVILEIGHAFAPARGG
jgi:rhodanese-related sulfurtransferase